MKTLALSCAAAMVTMTPAFAATYTMTFDDVSGDYAAFDDTVGDQPNVDVTNRTRTGFGNASVYAEHVEHWTTGYSELVDVAYHAGNQTVGELQFNVAAGYQLTIDQFDFGNYSNGTTPRDATFRVYDSNWTLIGESTYTGHTGNAVTDLLDISFTGSGYFQWGTDWSIGIDNLVYTVSPFSGTTDVPLPASLPLMLAGLGGLVALRRRG